MNDENNTPDLGGRPSIYSDELRDNICNRLADGESLRSICRDDDMPSRPTIARWIIENMGEVKDGDQVLTEGFYYHYTRAREIGLDVMADEILDISDDGSNDYMERELDNGRIIEVVNHENIARSRLRADSRKWYLSKMAPKRYGNERTIRHQQLDGDGEATDPVKPEVNIQMDEINKAIHGEMEKIVNQTKEE